MTVPAEADDMLDFCLDKSSEKIADVIDIVLFDMNYFPHKSQVTGWIAALQSRPDAGSEEISEAIAVCEHYLKQTG